MKAEITNTSKADQGVYTTDGLKFIAPGETRTLEIAKDYVERATSLPFLRVVPVGRPAASPTTDADPDDLDGMRVADLKKLAEDETIDLGDVTKKGDIIAAIRLARAVAHVVDADGRPIDPPAGNLDDEPVTIDTRTDDELRAAVVERFGEEGAADLDRQTMIDLLADEA